MKRVGLKGTEPERWLVKCHNADNVLSLPTSLAGRCRAHHRANVYTALLQGAGVRYSPFHHGFTGGTLLAFHDRPYILQWVPLYGDPATDLFRFAFSWHLGEKC